MVHYHDSIDKFILFQQKETSCGDSKEEDVYDSDDHLPDYDDENSDNDKNSYTESNESSGDEADNISEHGNDSDKLIDSVKNINLI